MLKLWFTGFFVLMIWVQVAQASLMITPKRVIFEPRDRAEVVNVVNDSNQTKTYRIDLINMLQKYGGGLIVKPNKKQLQQLNSAKRMIRFSPRQMTLAPGQAQKIRIGVRRPAGLSSGEYRTHMLFTELPPPNLITKQNDAKIQLHILMSFSIPIFVRATDFKAKVDMEHVIFVPNKLSSNGKPQIQFDLKRSGEFGVNGRVDVYWRSLDSGNYRNVGFFNNVAIYRENTFLKNNRVNLEMPTLKKGYYKLVYKGGKAFNNQVFVKKSFVYK
ncbi:fimbrial biogenesis chaperone [Hydrogenovibrio kuenenii]|uniref:fimbrial biogenesis chaperone n=1 Tax=Hydrogenovibrio kuenenii TaxID=63658 RepID=UPI0004632B50|nr:fimbria/pilus periplasmic chaperone [Hydrogenovibrio kuenenii]